MEDDPFIKLDVIGSFWLTTLEYGRSSEETYLWTAKSATHLQVCKVLFTSVILWHVYSWGQVRQLYRVELRCVVLWLR